MIKKTLRSLVRRSRKQFADATWSHLMKAGQAGWGRKPFDQEELRLVRDALVSQNLCCIGGQMVPAFEHAFAALHDVPYAVASTSGTAAIHVALGALDLEPGSEIITAPITDLGTIIPILAQGCIPVFADIDRTFNMDPADVERKITPRTRAILVVHLFGNPCDLGRMKDIAARHGVALIEDCSQAHLAEYGGRLVGTIGDIGCFSFQQSKHMTTGDGGMTITSNRQYFERMKLFADKGYARKGYGPRAYLFHAPNYRMTELVGAVGLAQLRKLPSIVARRRELGQYMTERLAGIPGVSTAPITPGATHSYWLYPVALRGGFDMTTVSRSLSADRVNAMVAYTGTPIYLCSESLAKKKTFGSSEWPFTLAPEGVVYEYKEGLCPNAEKALEHLICLPFDESWSQADVNRVTAAVARAVSRPAVAVVPSPGRTVATDAAPSTPARARLKVGIIGCGEMGRWHFDAYRKDPRVEVVAFADTLRANAEAFAAKAGGRAYASHLELLEGERLDAVSICTVPVSHRHIAVDALRAGVHVLCEKPLATTVDDARAMWASATAANRILVPAFKFRFFEEVQKARELVQSGALGAILQARLNFGGRIEMAGTWFARPEVSGGGVLMDNGPHAFDLLRFVLGPLASVAATVDTRQPIAVEDTAHVTCRLATGGTASVDLSWSTAVTGPHYFEIYGEQGAALLDSSGISYKLQTWPAWKRVSNTRDVREAFERQIDHFVRGFSPPSGEAEFIVNTEDGWQSQRLIDAAYRSAHTGQPINVMDEAHVHQAPFSGQQLQAHAG